MALLLFLVAILSAPASSMAGDTSVYGALYDLRKSDAIQRFGYTPDVSQKSSVAKELSIPVNTRPLVLKKDAAHCGAQDLSAKFGPVRNQSSLGWCFASVAADILSYKSGYRVSELDLGVQYFHLMADRRRGRDQQRMLPAGASVSDFWAGNIGEAVNVGIKAGVCRESEVSSADFIYNGWVKKGLGDIGSFPPNPDYMARLAIQRIESVVDLNFDWLDKNGNGAATCQAVEMARLLVPKVSTWEILQTISSSQTKEEALAWLMRKGCQRLGVDVGANFSFNTFVPVTPEGQLARGPLGSTLIPGVDELLSAGKPVPIGLNVKRLLASTYRDPAVKEAAHAAILVGRRFENGHCQYLLRNSVGPSCANYAPAFNPKKNCTRGNIWIPEKDLDAMISSIGRIQ